MIEKFTAFDIIIFIVIIIPAVFGVIKGFFRLVFGLIGTILGFGLAIVFSRPFGDFIAQLLKFKHTFSGRLTAFFLIFLSCWILGIATGYLMKKLFASLKLGWLDRIVGGMIGALKGFILVAFICIVIVVVPSFEPVFESSQLAKPIINGTSMMVSYLPDTWQNYLDPHRWIGKAEEGQKKPLNPDSLKSKSKKPGKSKG
ncbi:CvpA family protein [bacterium]|nr:CvpA family protein [candidate division CSSED10-310 bacterium]